MHRWEVKALFRKCEKDRQFAEGLKFAYENPDPRLGATPETLPFLANVTLPIVAAMSEEYRILRQRRDAPATLRLYAANTSLTLARLREVLEPIASRFVDQPSDKVAGG